MQNPNNPWEILPAENSADYELFHSYLELGKHRSYKLVARIKGFSVRTIAAKASHFDWYNRARNYDAHCFEQQHDVEIDLYKANKDMYFKIRNDINSKLTKLLNHFSEEFLENIACNPSPEIFNKLKHYQQVFKTIQILNKTIDFDRYPKADLPEMVSWKSTRDKGTFNKQPDANPEEFLEKFTADETLDDSAFNVEVGNYISQNENNQSSPEKIEKKLVKFDQSGNVTFTKPPENMSGDEVIQALTEYVEVRSSIEKSI